MDMIENLSYYFNDTANWILTFLSVAGMLFAFIGRYKEIRECNKRRSILFLSVALLLAFFSYTTVKSVKVPDVTGIYFEDARIRLMDQDLKYYGKLSDKSYVRYQNPGSGDIVRRGTVVYLEGEPDETRESTNPTGPKVPSVGSVITFGQYEQEGKTGTRAYPIYWRVLAVEGEKVLLVSDKSLAGKLYHEIYEPVTWENCSLRQWLNGSFYNTAFSSLEKTQIQLYDVENNAGADTQDHVFLLSLEEVNRFFPSERDRQCAATDHAVQDHGAFVDSLTGASWWWLRSRGNGDNTAVSINTDGSIDMSSRVVGKNGTVRPAMWVSFG